MIKVFNTRLEFDHYRNHLTPQSVGLIPTMGNLHEGHLSLIQKSIEENLITIVTIFVNPKQFGPNEDFNNYPRTLEDDLTKISELAIKLPSHKEIVVFAPKDNEEIYPKDFSTTISIGEMKNILCGKFRPVHFDGVTTVVYRLFKITKPTTAYFGQKDYQQCLIIKKMVSDLELNINIKIMPIIRNIDGLALSSRNQYLKDKNKDELLFLNKTLKEIEFHIKNKKSFGDLIESKMEDSKWDYLEVLDSNNLKNISEQTKEVVIIGAYRIDNTRLLDNILVTLP